jgi:hypothetical protein
MRAPDLLALAFTALAASAPVTLRAQDPADSLPTVEPADSATDADEDWREPEDAERPVRRREGGGNPYLREVAEEQAAYRRGPFWASGGLGAGGEAIASPGVGEPYSRSRIAPTLSVALGGTVGQQLRLGFDGFVWINPLGGGTVETVTAGLLTGRVYPLRRSGLFVKAGAGFGRYGEDLIDDCDCNGTIVSDFGFAWVLGAGFEAPVGRGLWVGPVMDVIRMNVSGPDGYRERVINFGISITYDGKN